jgi:hypothetical protein
MKLNRRKKLESFYRKYIAQKEAREIYNPSKEGSCGIVATRNRLGGNASPPCEFSVAGNRPDPSINLADQDAALSA